MTPNPNSPPAIECARRMVRFRTATARRGLDATLALTEVNRRYLTGFRSSNGLLAVPRGGEALFLTDFRYLEMARHAIAVARVVLQGKPAEQLGGLAKRQGWRRVGYEGSLTTLQLRSLREAMPTVAEWVECEGDIVALRAVKSLAEQRIVRRAVALGDEVFRRTIEEVRPGMTEWDVRRVLRGWVDRLDAEGESFDCIVAAGAAGSQPHAIVTQRVLRRGQPLLIDMGIVLGGYCSDMTRTVFLGKPSDTMRRIYDITLEAQLRGIAAVRAGASCGDVDQAARAYIAKKGHGKHFGHNLGHGVGIQIHESPRLRPGADEVLKPGMVVTVEPGIYLPGVGGVRIEDMVIVRRDGCEILTGTPKELLVL
jgi:Xaa-Pro aminopeptidase